MAAGDLAKLEDVKEWMGIDPGDTEADNLLKRLISASSSRFKVWTGRGDELLLGSRVDTFSGTGGTCRTLPSYPVVSVESVKVNDNPILQRANTLAPGWVKVEDRVELSGYVFACGIANCEIQFTAGVDPAAVPEDLKQAICELVQWKFGEKERQGQQSKTVGGETVVFKLSEAPDSVKAVVDTYARKGWH